MIHITDAAQEHFSKLLINRKPGTQIRVFVINPGTIHAECGVSYCPPDSVKANDIELKYDKMLAYVDELSVPYLKDAEIDFITNKFGSQITLRAPNATICKISDDSPLTKRIEYLLQLRINPMLSSHGGHVELIEITDDMHAILKFSGGCNGCSMAYYTLKEGIEKELLQQFPELKGVSDITHHKHGSHSYY